ncbi:hypothetical protein Tco_0308237 [Tanacetum coccineum]
MEMKPVKGVRFNLGGKCCFEGIRERCLAVDVFACFMVLPCIGPIFKNYYLCYDSSDYFYFFGHISSISVEISVAPEVRAVAVASPAGVLGNGYSRKGRKSKQKQTKPSTGMKRA